MVQAAKISGSRSAAPGALRVRAAGGVRWGPPRLGGQVVPGEPDPGRQREHGRDAGNDAEQSEPFAAPSGRKQRGGERADGDAAQAETEPAHETDNHHDGLGLAREQGQGRRPEQHRSGREHRPVAEPSDPGRRGCLRGHRAEQQGPGDQPGA